MDELTGPSRLLKHAIGKTITHVIHRNGNLGGLPAQVILGFDDASCLEIYGDSVDISNCITTDEPKRAIKFVDRPGKLTTEHTRLAWDLYDSVAQALYSIKLYGEASRMAYKADNWEQVIQNLEEINAVAQEALTDMRVLIHELHPPILSEIGLAAALWSRLEAVEAQAGIEVALEVEGDRKLPEEVETDLFRVSQEALTNIFKHSHASRVKVQLFLDEHRVQLSIQDNGIGFDLTKAEASQGVGLHSIRERVKRIGGVLRIETAPGQGTKLVVEL